MTTEELNALIAQAEGGDVPAMNQLTHIYGEEEGFINHEQAAKWFLELIKRDCNLNSGVYENTGYNKGLYEKIKNTILHSVSVNELASLSGSSFGGSLLGGSMSFTSSNAKLYINQAEEAIKQNIINKEEKARKKADEEAHKKAEEERLARERRKQARREREEQEERKSQTEYEKLINELREKVMKGDVEAAVKLRVYYDGPEDEYIKAAIEICSEPTNLFEVTRIAEEIL